MIPRVILSNCPTDPPPRERNVGYGDHQADRVIDCTTRLAVVDGRGGDGCFDEVSSPGTPLRLTGRGEVYVVGDSVDAVYWGSVLCLLLA